MMHFSTRPVTAMQLSYSFRSLLSQESDQLLAYRVAVRMTTPSNDLDGRFCQARGSNPG